MKRLFAILALATVALAAAACSTTKADEPSGPVASVAPGGASGPVIVAQGMKFQPSEVAVPAGAAFQLTFDNQDSAPHNVAIYTDSSASQSVSKSDIYSSASKTFEVPALAAGTYFFRCDVHPEMTGTIVAK